MKEKSVLFNWKSSNKKLKEYCVKYNYIFFDVYDKYTDEDGFLNTKLSDGAIHIGDGTFINDFIKQELE